MFWKFPHVVVYSIKPCDNYDSRFTFIFLQKSKKGKRFNLNGMNPIDDVIDQFDGHYANYDHLLHHNYFFTYFLLGYFQGKVFLADSVDDMVFCNMSEKHLSLIYDSDPESSSFYYVANESNTQAYADIFPAWNRTRNDCSFGERFPHLLVCSCRLNSASKTRLKNSCKIKKIPPFSRPGVVSNQTNFTTKYKPKLEILVRQTVDTVNQFSRANPNIIKIHSSAYLYITIGYFVACFEHDSNDFTVSVGTTKFSFGHVILIGHLVKNKRSKIEYVSLRFLPAKTTPDNHEYSVEIPGTTPLVQIDLVLTNGLGTIVDKKTNVETSRYISAYSFLQHMINDEIDKMLMNLSELFNRLYTILVPEPKMYNLSFFIGYFLAWRLTEHSFPDIRLSWFKDPENDNSILLGIFVSSPTFFGKSCLLIQSPLFLPADSQSYVVGTGKETLSSCFLANIAQQKISGHHAYVSRIQQIWKMTLTLDDFLQIRSQDRISYTYERSVLENLAKVVPKISQLYDIVNTCYKFTQFAAGFSSYHHDNTVILTENMIKVKPAYRPENLIVFRNKQSLPNPLILGENCTKVNMILCEVDIKARTVKLNYNSKIFNRYRKYCAKQKTLLVNYTTQNSSFSINANIISDKEQQFNIIPSTLSHLEYNALLKQIKSFGSIWQLVDKVSIINHENSTSGKILLDPMSHTLLLLKSTSIDREDNLVQVVLEPQGVSRRFKNYEFISSFLAVQKLIKLCPAKVTFTGRFFDSFRAKRTTTAALLIRKFTSSTVQWFGLGKENPDWRAFCTSYQYISNETQFVSLNEIAQCSNSGVLKGDFAENLFSCTIPGKIPQYKTNKSLTVDINDTIYKDIELFNEYLPSGITYRIFHRRSGKFRLITPPIQYTEMNHQTFFLSFPIDYIVSLRYFTNNNVKIIDLHIAPSFRITIRIENYKNNFAFHVLRTIDNYVIIVHPLTRIMVKIGKNNETGQHLNDFMEKFSVMLIQPERKLVSFYLSNNELQKSDKSHLVNWVKNDPELETRLEMKNISWVLEIASKYNNGSSINKMQPVYIESDRFESFGTRLISLKDLCWQLKESQAELVLKIDPSPLLFTISLLVQNVFDGTVNYFGKIHLKSRRKPITKVYLELEYIHVLQKILNSWTLTPYKLDLPINVRWLILKPESLVRPVAYRMRCATSNLQYLRVENSILFNISIVLDDREDLVFVLCYSYFTVEYAFPRISLEFENEVYIIERSTSLRLFSWYVSFQMFS